MSRLEYIWLDGNEELPQLRSKTKFCETDEIPEWNFDGGSTKQGSLEDSDRVLKPVATYTDPFALDGLLVLCEVFYHNGDAHGTNNRYTLHSVDVGDSDPWIGFEQEFTLLHPISKEPLGMLLQPEEQGQYYCGVGRQNTVGRDVMKDFEEACIVAGVDLDGINAEVMPGQWEFQTRAKDAKKACDDLWMARYILERVSEDKGVQISYEPKPHPDFNGAGCHTNFSTAEMRKMFGINEVENLMEALEMDHEEYIKVCGVGTEQRLTGLCETSDYAEFSWGEGDRGASVRIPQKVSIDGAGYIEDRRPSANIDPYQVVFSLLQTTKKSNLL
jgi:glutamine synthetase